MKWIALLSLTLALAACGLGNTDIVDSRQVLVADPTDITWFQDQTSLDVTNTTVKHR